MTSGRARERAAPRIEIRKNPLEMPKNVPRARCLASGALV